MRRWPLWLFIGSLSLRLVSIAGSLLWYDETFTAIIARLPFARMLSAVNGDVHPPLWYAIEWIIAHTIGASELTLRLPAAFFGAGSVVLLYQLMKRLVGENEGRWASGLMTIMPGQLYYSQEARMYSLLTFLVLLGAISVHDKKWLRTGLVLVLILFTQNLGAVYVALLGGWALWSSRGRAIRTLAPVSLAYLPQGLIALKQFKSMAGGFWLAPSGNLGGALYYLFFTTFFVRLPEFLQLHAVALALILTLTSLIVLRGKLKQLAPLMTLAFGPSAMLYVASLLFRPVLLDRALLPAGAAVVGLWGASLPALPKWGRVPLAALGLPILLVGIITFYLDPNEQRPKHDPVVGMIRQQWQPGDAVYHTHLASYIVYDWYMPEKPAFVLPESGDLAQSLTDETKAAMGINDHEYLPQALRAIGYKRLWLISGRTVVTSQLELDAQELYITTYRVIRHWNIVSNKFEALDVYLLDIEHEPLVFSH